MLQRLPHLLGIETLTREQIIFILDQAKPFQEFQRYPLKKLATLRGKTVAVAFFEPSTRTRISFTTAASRLVADTMALQAESSSLKKGESLIDTVRTIEAMRPDGIVIRHSSSGAPEFVAEVASSSLAIDLNAKRKDYARYGVLEYLVLNVRDQRFHWFDLAADRELSPDAAGVYRPQTFPGLWIDGPAVLARNFARTVATMNAGLATPDHAAFVAKLAAAKKA